MKNIVECVVCPIFLLLYRQNVGAILIQNEDLNALHITGITLSVTQCLSKWYYN